MLNTSATAKIICVITVMIIDLLVFLTFVMSLHFTETFDKYFTTSGSLLCLRIRTERLEFSSASFVETAEHLIIFQTEYLNSYDQAFHTAYEQVA